MGSKNKKTKDKKKGKKTNKEPLVIVHTQAYLTMLKHVLRFGSKSKHPSQYKECMGMLIGKLGEKKDGDIHDLIIENAVPVTHGSDIDVAFKEMDYVKFTEINDHYHQTDKEIFNVGWYHSHPGLTTFLSAVDINNQMNFQTNNPSAIAIVWDHDLLEENHIGFVAYRLKSDEEIEHDRQKGTSTKLNTYKEVKIELIPPDNVGIYKSAIKDIIDLQNEGNPPILEISELSSVIGDFEPRSFRKLFSNETSHSHGAKKSTHDEHSDHLLPEIQKSFQIFDKSSFDKNISPLLNYIEDLMAKQFKITINKNDHLTNNTINLAKTLKKKVNDMQFWFEKNLNEIFVNMWNSVNTQLEQQINDIRPIFKKISNSVENEDMDIAKTRELQELIQATIKKLEGEISNGE